VCTATTITNALSRTNSRYGLPSAMVRRWHVIAVLLLCCLVSIHSGKVCGAFHSSPGMPFRTNPSTQPVSGADQSSVFVDGPSRDRAFSSPFARLTMVPATPSCVSTGTPVPTVTTKRSWSESRDHPIRPDDARSCTPSASKSDVDDVPKNSASREEEDKDRPPESGSAQPAGRDDDSLTRTEAAPDDQRKAARIRAALLANRAAGTRPRRRNAKATGKPTSVGVRRVGSATHARQAERATHKVLDILRKAAPRKDHTDPPTKASLRSSALANTAASTTKSIIHSVIDDLLGSRRNSDPRTGKLDTTSFSTQHDRLATAFSSLTHSEMGLLGEPIESPRTIILAQDGAVSVQLATPLDDVDIANLRLSVFSDFSADLQAQFCSRSCQAMARRRMRGATCIVATKATAHTEPSTTSRVILGSAECSFHEFYNTQLGSRRPRYGLLYLTEVAVHPSARRQGIGLRLLDAMDRLARDRHVETLYLHVDTMNYSALQLYHKAGYQIAPDRDVFLDFTSSLNLHPGATKGRDHFLLYKDLRPDPTWLLSTEQHCQERWLGREEISA
jgi:ribosomal protein S18 acetylase RimI-like enzyme